MNTFEMLTIIAVIAFATFATRALPFICFCSKEPPAILATIEKNLPPMILMLLVIYCLKDVEWLSAPYGIPELLTIAVVSALHLWKRSPMLSIFTGTIIYMTLVQLDVFSFL
jgi:branched-subunit amino acid transport protein AzlD